MLHSETTSDRFYAVLAEALQAGEAVALATVVQAEGSAPRGPGAQMLIWGRERTLGSVGGGMLEARVVDDALQALASGRSGLHDYSLRAGEAGSLGVCGGRALVFIHVLRPRPRLIVAGAGHVAQPLAQLAAQAGYSVLVVDDRPELAVGGRFPDAETQVVDFTQLRAEVRLDALTSVVVVTRSHEHDETVLRQLLDQPLAYLGVMGSRAKVRRMFQRLRAEGCTTAQLERVRAPIGLDIGAETPAELAVSIVAELIQAARGGSGLPLSQVRQRDAAGEA